MNVDFQRRIVLCGLFVALNVGLGKVSNLLALPFTMDTVGTVIAAAMLPLPLVLVVGGVSSLVASVIIHPAFIYFIGTQLVIGAVAFALVRAGMFKVVWKAVIAGAIIGISSAIASAPVIVIVFGGVAVPSISALSAVFLASGKSLWASVISGSLIVESIDKIFAAVISWMALQRIKPGKTG